MRLKPYQIFRTVVYVTALILAFASGTGNVLFIGGVVASFAVLMSLLYVIHLRKEVTRLSRLLNEFSEDYERDLNRYLKLERRYNNLKKGQVKKHQNVPQ